MRFVAALGLLALAACAPMSLDHAEATCVADAKAARGPTGTVAVGTTTEGPRAKADITISTDWISGRDPDEVYAACVQRRAGQPPATPLADRPEWRP